LEAEEFVITSDQYDMEIFLVKFPMAGMAEHKEEKEQDAFAFWADRSQGLNWTK
jgi:hypothetical protein